MDTKTLVKIINRELNSVQEIAQSFQTEETIHELEINLMLSKIKEVYNLLAMLKPQKEVGLLKEVPFQEIATEHIEKVKSNDNWQEEKEVKNNCSALTNPTTTPPTPISEAKNEELEERKEEEIILTKEFPDFEEKETSQTTNLQKDKGIIFEEEEPQSKDTEVQEQKQKQIEKKSQLNNILADRFQDKKISLNDMLAGFKNDKDIAALLTARPIDNLKNAVKINDRIWYIQELFDHNADLYTQTIEAVNNSEHLDDALSYLFSRFDWDQNKKSTISFLELIYRRFTKL